MFLCIFHVIPATYGCFGQPFSAFEPDEAVKRESIKILKEIHDTGDSSDESSDSDGVDELRNSSVAEQEEKYGEPIEDYYEDRLSGKS